MDSILNSQLAPDKICPQQLPPYRVGFGEDLHVLRQEKPAIFENIPDFFGLRLGGVLINTPLWTVVAHSDGDVLLHALTDALLGAAGAGDIGDHFPDTDEKNRGRNSTDFVRFALHLLEQTGYKPLHVDTVVFLQAPRLTPYKSSIKNSIADILGINPLNVNIKAKSGEGVDAVGTGLAIRATAVVIAGLV